MTPAFTMMVFAMRHAMSNCAPDKYYCSKCVHCITFAWLHTGSLSSRTSTAAPHEASHCGFDWSHCISHELLHAVPQAACASSGSAQELRRGSIFCTAAQDGRAEKGLSVMRLGWLNCKSLLHVLETYLQSAVCLYLYLSCHLSKREVGENNS